MRAHFGMRARANPTDGTLTQGTDHDRSVRFAAMERQGNPGVAVAYPDTG